MIRMKPLRCFCTSLLLVFSSYCMAISVAVQITHETCSYANGQLTAVVSGGTPPYTYQWSTGATSQTIQGLGAGTYSVMVIDNAEDEVTGEAEVLSQPYSFEAYTSGLPWCNAPHHVFGDPLLSGLGNTWTVNGFPAVSSMWDPAMITFPTNPSEGYFEYVVDDGNGCTGAVTGTNGIQITNWPQISVVGVEPSCSNEALGEIRLSVDGQIPQSEFATPYISLMDNGGIIGGQGVLPDGNGFASFTDLYPGDYGICWWMGVTAAALDPGECDYDTVWVSVPNVGDICGYLSGTSFVDLNGDCQQELGEVGIPYSPLRVQPGDEIVYTDQDGHFTIPLLNGSYTLEQLDANLEAICPVSFPMPFTIDSDQPILDLANTSLHPLDLTASISSTLFRPGFESNYVVQVRNHAAEISGAVSVTVELDPVVSLVNTPAGATVNGTTLTWELPSLGPYATFDRTIRVLVPPGTALGTVLTSSISVSNTLSDADPTNNTDSDLAVVVGSYDPNDKRATTSSRASEDLYFINDDEWIDYTIRFQNTGTFYAEFVVITDTLPATLDMLTFEQGVASHPFTVSFKPGRIVEWRFDNIFLPDSTTDEPGSHGLVKFRIAPHAPLLPGTEIENIANIYFDFNPPVITEPSVLVAEFSTSIASNDLNGINISPNPATDIVNVRSIRNTDLLVVELLSIDGRKLPVPMRLNGQLIELDVRSLATGVYLVRTASGQGKFVKH